MKFILMVESDGYQVRYWDEMNEEIGESIATSWDFEELYKSLDSKGFEISRKTLEKAMKVVEESDEPFIVLKSKQKTDVSLDTFCNDLFVIDEE